MHKLSAWYKITLPGLGGSPLPQFLMIYCSRKIRTVFMAVFTVMQGWQTDEEEN